MQILGDSSEISYINESIEVEASLRDVYEMWSDLERFPEFMSGVHHVEYIADDITRWDISIAGVKYSFDARTTEQQQDYNIAWETVDTDWPHAGQAWFELVSARKIIVHFEIAWRPETLIEKLGAALSLDGSQAATMLKQFKKRVENVEPQPEVEYVLLQD